MDCKDVAWGQCDKCTYGGGAADSTLGIGWCKEVVPHLQSGSGKLPRGERI